MDRRGEIIVRVKDRLRGKAGRPIMWCSFEGLPHTARLAILCAEEPISVNNDLKMPTTPFFELTLKDQHIGSSTGPYLGSLFDLIEGTKQPPYRTEDIAWYFDPISHRQIYDHYPLLIGEATIRQYFSNKGISTAEINGVFELLRSCEVI